MSDTPRIEALRRRIEQDPASVTFAQLAEEYRRAGQFAEAVRVCRAGLERHPAYLSARVTLGRALLELGELEAAEAEFADVHRAAPENLAAMRGLDEIRARREADRPAAPPWTPANRPDAHEDTGMGVGPGEGPTTAAVDPATARQVADLETWLAAIQADRERRAKPH